MHWTAMHRHTYDHTHRHTHGHTNGHTHGHLWSSLRSFMFVLLIPCLFLAGISRQETPQPKVAAMDESVADTVGAIGSLHKLPWLDSTHLTLTLRMCA